MHAIKDELIDLINTPCDLLNNNLKNNFSHLNDSFFLFILMSALHSVACLILLYLLWSYSPTTRYQLIIVSRALRTLGMV